MAVHVRSPSHPVSATGSPTPKALPESVQPVNDEDDHSEPGAGSTVPLPATCPLLKVGFVMQPAAGAGSKLTVQIGAPAPADGVNDVTLPAVVPVSVPSMYTRYAAMPLKSY